MTVGADTGSTGFGGSPDAHSAFSRFARAILLSRSASAFRSSARFRRTIRRARIARLRRNARCITVTDRTNRCHDIRSGITNGRRNGLEVVSLSANKPVRGELSRPLPIGCEVLSEPPPVPVPANNRLLRLRRSLICWMSAAKDACTAVSVAGRTKGTARGGEGVVLVSSPDAAAIGGAGAAAAELPPPPPPPLAAAAEKKLLVWCGEGDFDDCAPPLSTDCTIDRTAGGPDCDEASGGGGWCGDDRRVRALRTAGLRQ